MSRLDEWNRLMRGLPEAALMEIMNNYLGGIETPYDKNTLLQRLSDRLLLPVNAKNTADRITAMDLKLLSAVQWFDHPDRKSLTDFFSRSISPTVLSERLINMEERLLIFYDRSTPSPGLVLSPLLPEAVEEQLSPLKIISFRYETAPAAVELPLINGSFLICFFSLLNEDQRICNNDGSIKKRFTSALARIFPASGFSDEPNETLHLLLNAFKTLNLLTESNGEWRLKMENLKAFSILDRREQLLWVWGALCTRDYSRAAGCGSLIAALAEQFPPGAGLDAGDLESLFLLLKDRVLPEGDSPSPGFILRILKHFGFFTINEDIFTLHPMIPLLLDRERPVEGSLFLHATFDANLTPDTPFSLPLALALSPERYDSFAQLNLSDSSFRRLLKTGLVLEDLKREIHERYSLSLTQNILFSLKDWEEDYAGLRLWEGIVLEVRSDRIPLIEQNTRMKGLIRRSLGEGIYLLAKEDREEWEDALKETGIETIPRTEKPGRKKKTAIRYEKIENRAPRFSSLVSPKVEIPLQDPKKDKTLDAEIEELKSYARTLAGLSEDERDEIQGRIDRGVILEKEQIRPGMIRKELTMVKGLDYQGKLRMIQSVMGNRAYQLDVTIPTDDFDLITHRIIPRSMEQEKDTQALLTGTELPDRPFQCPVRKISRIRKIRSSLF